MSGFLHGLIQSSGWWLYVVLGGLAFAEAAIFLGFVLPGETALLVGGFLAHQGTLSPAYHADGGCRVRHCW